MKSILYILLFVSTIVSSQQTQITNLRDVFTLQNDLDPYTANADIKGTPFIHSEFENIIIQGKKMKGRYNANQDYIELDKDGKTVFFLPAIEYRYEVKFTDLNVSYRAFEYEKFKYTFYKISAQKGKTYLLTKEFVKLKPEVKAKSNFDVAKPAKFERKKDVHFMKFSDQDLVIELPTEKAGFLLFLEKNQVLSKATLKRKN